MLPKKNETEVPDIVKEENDDKPAAHGIIWTIAIAVLILAIAYLFFLKS